MNCIAATRKKSPTIRNESSDLWRNSHPSTHRFACHFKIPVSALDAVFQNPLHSNRPFIVVNPRALFGMELLIVHGGSDAQIANERNTFQRPLHDIFGA